MDGITMGGGAGLCMQAPFRIATEKTMFAMPETKIGYCPDVGASAFLARLDGELGTYLALTSEIISGREVYELGLATHFVPSTSLPALLRALQALEEPSWEAVDATIEGFYIAPEELGVGGDFEGQVNKEQAEGVPPSERYARTQGGQPQTQAPGQSSVLALPTGPHSGAVRAAIDRAFSRPSVAGILHELSHLAEHGLALPSASNAEAEKEQVKKWAGRVMGVLGMRSPTSLVVSLEAQRRGREAVRGWPASGLLRMELGIATASVFPRSLYRRKPILLAWVKSRSVPDYDE
ncbi:ClpP/crotonase [Gloeophyllum trabeum ATCC 11539]|uniref:3-hydroxyisobutyryl-CoA hydrolase n=1 Tax=Gloeophyllum trabeum (strain ATCC 11539 / FP-39264 / Madison 617) TaxID=670483 RepID=S7RX47_GLOTA|nr:ClpP/crotonase [Gloeophyllum trabeum ATCC 11539]EPQ57919.1 ClpP/crotonase [Gloeophyllum trabeum ATCC 11539]